MLATDMPSSEFLFSKVGAESSAGGGGDYPAALASFAARHVRGQGWQGAVEAYHAVRAMPYFSGPDRSPLAALRSGRGACTARHIVLRDLLRGLGIAADVELVDCDFAAAIPPHPTMEPSLKALAGAGGIRDMHCWVRARNGETAVLMDATWCDDLAAYGFPVNSGWTGDRDTRPAVANGVVRAAAEDVLASKEELLAELTNEEVSARRAFLAALSTWLEELP